MSGRQTIKGEYIHLLADNPIIGTTSERTIPSVTNTLVSPSVHDIIVLGTNFSIAATLTGSMFPTSVVSVNHLLPDALKNDNTVRPPAPTSIVGKEVRWAGITPTSGLCGFTFRGLLFGQVCTDSATTAAPVAGATSPYCRFVVSVSRVNSTGTTAVYSSQSDLILNTFAAGGVNPSHITIPVEFIIPFSPSFPVQEVYITMAVSNVSDKTIIGNATIRGTVSQF